jgi:stage II sporulation protein R
MKKVILIISFIIFIFFVLNNKYEDIIIPHEAIRLRVIANSSSIIDQHLKAVVRDNTQSKVYNLLKDVESVEDAREILKKEIEEIDRTVKDTLEEQGSDQNYNVTYGYNYFPQKEYKGIIQPEGYYESLYIELGEAKGDNWWCILFPPLCLIEAEEANEVEYKFFVIELIEKYFKK